MRKINLLILTLIFTSFGRVISLKRPTQIEDQALIRGRRRSIKSRSDKLSLVGLELRGGSKYYKYYSDPDEVKMKDRLKVGAALLIPTIWYFWPMIETSFGGSGLNKDSSYKRKERPKNQQNKMNLRSTNIQQQQQTDSKVGLISLIPVAFLLWIFRDKWTYIIKVLNKEVLQDKTLQILDTLNDMPRYYSYPLYTLGMTLWEICGLSTIPVETAAGMVFGWPAVALSGTGKLLGAMTAFFIGRHGMFAKWIRNKLSNNSFIQLARDSAEKDPFLVSLILRGSCFPETIKNYGAAILRPIQLWMFLVGLVLHGGFYTFLWSYLGVDTTTRLETTYELPPNRLLQLLLALGMGFGFVVSPLLMGYWAKNLKNIKTVHK